jgi:archaellum biogenesis ATPase FlaH
MTEDFDSVAKQKLYIDYLISSNDIFGLCQSIIIPEYFNPELRKSVEFIQSYYEKYNKTPTPDIISAETSVECSVKEITMDQYKYISDSISAFCKRKAIEKAVLSSPALIEKGEYEMVEKNIKEAVMISLHTNLGLRYFDTVSERLDRMLEGTNMISTGWEAVDKLLYGGICRKELVLFAANSGGGKSVCLANLGLNFIKQKYNVLYVSLELSEDTIAQRFDTMLTGYTRENWKKNVGKIKSEVIKYGDGYGVMDIIQMKSGTKPNQIKSFLKTYFLHYSFMPDLLIVDYLDKMSPNSKVSADNISEKDKLCSEQLRDIGVEYDLCIATASQLNRSAVNAKTHDHSQIAGGMTKINEADTYISILMNDIMRAQGEMNFFFQKTRNSDGVGSIVPMNWDKRNLLITDSNRQVDSGIEMNIKPKTVSILDLMKV